MSTAITDRFLVALSNSFILSESRMTVVSSDAQFKLFTLPFQDTSTSRMDRKQNLAVEKLAVPGCHVFHLFQIALTHASCLG